MSALTLGLLRNLSETPGAPGDEGPVRDLIARAIRSHVDEMRIDRMGNLIALKRGTGISALKVAAAAHMDEVALFVNEVDKDGFLHFLDSGGVNTRTLLGTNVQVGPNQLPGVIGLRPVHFADQADYSSVPRSKDLVIDIGASDQAAANAVVKVGQRAVFLTRFGFLGPARKVEDDAPLPDRGRIKGKAFDDRLGCITLIGLLAGERQPFDLYGVFTVQEEIGMRGAFGAGYDLAPDVVLVLEGTVCDDVPGLLNADRPPPTTRLGNGPALTQRDRSAIVHPRLLQHLIRTAAEHGIPYQFKQPAVGGTDAAGFGHRRAIPVAIVSTPCRYIHGPVAVAELSDLRNGLALLAAALPGIGKLFEQKETVK